MQKYLILLALFFVSCSPKYTEKAMWQSGHVSIDANTSEYGKIRYGNSETKLLYSIYNDSDNLYVCLTTSDNNTQHQIMLGGMEVWIDTVKKSLQHTGIKYPLKVNQPQDFSIKPNIDSAQKRDFHNLRQQFLLNQSVMDISGFKNYQNGLYSLETKKGIKVKMGWDSSTTLIYEIQIPLESWYKKLVFADSAKVFTLTVNINAVPVPNMGNQPPDGMPGGGPPGGPPMGQMGGMPPGMPPMGGGQMGGMMAMSEPHSFKMNFKLNMHAK